MTGLHPTRFSVALGAALLLAACGDETVPEGDDSRSASGEVLEGTISDDMLALDKVRSQAPLLQEAEGAAGDGSAATSAEEESVQEPAPEQESAPAEPPDTLDEAFSDEG